MLHAAALHFTLPRCRLRCLSHCSCVAALPFSWPPGVLLTCELSCCLHVAFHVAPLPFTLPFTLPWCRLRCLSRCPVRCHMALHIAFAVHVAFHVAAMPFTLPFTLPFTSPSMWPHHPSRCPSRCIAALMQMHPGVAHAIGCPPRGLKNIDMSPPSGHPSSSVDAPRGNAWQKLLPPREQHNNVDKSFCFSFRFPFCFSRCSTEMQVSQSVWCGRYRQKNHYFVPRL